MRNANWLIAAGLIAATTTGCVETGYPTPYYGSNPAYAQSGYGYGSGYAYGRQQPGYYGQQGYGYYGQQRYHQPARRWW